MIDRTDKPFTLRHVLWHWILGIVMVADGLVAILSLGLLHSWFTTAWIESPVGDRLYSHTSQMTKAQVAEQVAEELGLEIHRMQISQAMLDELKGFTMGGVMPTKTPNPKDFN